MTNLELKNHISQYLTDGSPDMVIAVLIEACHEQADLWLAKDDDKKADYWENEACELEDMFPFKKEGE